MFKSKFKVVYDSLNDIYQVEERKWYSFLYWPTEYFYKEEWRAGAISNFGHLDGKLDHELAKFLMRHDNVQELVSSSIQS